MEEELKEVWTTLILPVTKFSNNDYYRRKDKGQIEAFDNLSEYKPTYLPVGAMGYDGSNKTYRLLKTIKVRNSDGSFDYYMVPEFAVEGVYVDLPKTVVEPIADLVTLNNQQAIILPLKISNPVPTKSNTVIKLPVLRPVPPKSTPIVKLPVPLNLLPYIANVTSDGVAFFNIPEGYTLDLFNEAIKAVYSLNNGLTQKPMVYYEQPKQLILQQKLQLLAALLSLKLYLAQRLQAALRLSMKYTTNGLTKTIIAPSEYTDKPDLVTEVFAYPYREVNMYNIHPEAYLKVLEYLNNNFNKTKTNNKQEKKYILSTSGFNKVPVGGEVNDSIFHYIGKDGLHEVVQKFYPNNANIISKNEPFTFYDFVYNINTDNGKAKLYSYSDDDKIYYKDVNGFLINKPFNLSIGREIDDYLFNSTDEYRSYLKDQGLTELQIADYIDKNKNVLFDLDEFNIDKSFFRPTEKELPTLNNSSLLTSNSGNVVLKVKQTVKLTARKIRSFLGFLNGGQLKYYKNGK